MTWNSPEPRTSHSANAGATRTRAELRDGQWVIDGAKQFITNSGTELSAGVTITAVTAKRAGHTPSCETSYASALAEQLLIEMQGGAVERHQ